MEQNCEVGRYLCNFAIEIPDQLGELCRSPMLEENRSGRGERELDVLIRPLPS